MRGDSDTRDRGLLGLTYRRWSVLPTLGCKKAAPILSAAEAELFLPSCDRCLLGWRHLLLPGSLDDEGPQLQVAGQSALLRKEDVPCSARDEADPVGAAEVWSGEDEATLGGVEESWLRIGSSADILLLPLVMSERTVMYRTGFSMVRPVDRAERLRHTGDAIPLPSDPACIRPVRLVIYPVAERRREFAAECWAILAVLSQREDRPEDRTSSGIARILEGEARGMEAALAVPEREGLALSIADSSGQVVWTLHLATAVGRRVPWKATRSERRQGRREGIYRRATDPRPPWNFEDPLPVFAGLRASDPPMLRPSAARNAS
jgi:hypothetical protein